jgi:hypothetical protein
MAAVTGQLAAMGLGRTITPLARGETFTF